MNTPESTKTNACEETGREQTEIKPHFRYKSKLITDTKWRLLNQKKATFLDFQKYEKERMSMEGD